MLDIKELSFKILGRIVQVMEIVLAVGLIFGVVGGMVFGAKHLWITVTGVHGQSFQVIIDQSMLYIIALEIAMMLIKHDSKIVLDILIFAIARKMIIETPGGYETFLSALAICMLYVVRYFRFDYISRFWKTTESTVKSPVEQSNETHEESLQEKTVPN